MFDDKQSNLKEERNSRKEPLSDAEASQLIKGVSKVLVAKGKKVTERPSKEATLADLKGPTGNYRAPIVQVGKTLLVGFNEDSLASLL